MSSNHVHQAFFHPIFFGQICQRDWIDFCKEVISCIVILINGKCLIFLTEKHRHQAIIVEHIVFICTYSDVGRTYQVHFTVVLQYQVDGRLFTETLSAKHFNGLMILQHFDGLHPFLRNVVGSQGITVVHQVHSFDVELVDALTIETDLPVGIHFHSRHLGNDISNVTVLWLGKPGYGIHQGILFLHDTIGGYLDFL